MSPTGYPSYTAGYNEITMTATNGTAYSPATKCSANTLGTYCQYRMAHNWGTGSVQDFTGQNEEGAISRDGTFMAWATDVMGTRGSVSPDWTSNHSYNPGDIINPLAASNTNHSSYQNLTGVLFSSAPTPPGELSWGSCQTSGQTCTELSGGGVWTNVSQAATGSTGQLPCNGLRGDLDPTGGASIYLNTTIYPVGNNVAGNIYQATGCIPISPATSCTLTTSSYITESNTIPNWGSAATTTGTVNTSGTAVTWVSGSTFNSLWVGLPMKIAGTPYTVSLVNSSTSITLTGSAGTQTGSSYSVANGCPSFGNLCNDASGIVWTNRGANDCRCADFTL